MPGKRWIDANKEHWLATRRRWYKKNSPHARVAVDERKRELRRWLEDYKSTLKCQQCGEDDIVALDFHHRIPAEKEISITKAIHDGWGIDRILSEIAKCDILCANCHRRLHSGQ